jgi:hypothetical protein
MFRTLAVTLLTLLALSACGAQPEKAPQAAAATPNLPCRSLQPTAAETPAHRRRSSAFRVPTAPRPRSYTRSSIARTRSHCTRIGTTRSRSTMPRKTAARRSRASTATPASRPDRARGMAASRSASASPAATARSRREPPRLGISCSGRRGLPRRSRRTCGRNLHDRNRTGSSVPGRGRKPSPHTIRYLALGSLRTASWDARARFAVRRRASMAARGRNTAAGAANPSVSRR